ncbi:MAG: phage portal protein [Methylophilaceae bacterium]
MNIIDWIVEFGNPMAGLKRRAARGVIASYDAAKPSRLRKFQRGDPSPNTLTSKSAIPLRVQARHLERNHDIARGIIRTLVNNVVGASGIGVEPQPRRKDGTIHKEYAKALRDAYRDWQRTPEVTHTFTFSKAQRMMARAWLRDGESFAQQLIGKIATLDHGTRVPYSLELFESDLVPMDYEDGDRIRQGIERNAWGRRVNYFVYKQHPSDLGLAAYRGAMKKIPADRVLQVASFDRIGQLRGISEFASVITRLDDIKDYEESERIAAKIAASLTAYIKKGSPDTYQPAGEGISSDGSTAPAREISFSPGMVIDSLGAGEEIGMIDSKRPNPNVVVFRSGQLKAVASGVGAGYSSISKNYDGTYSAQRQELIEQWVNYAVLTDEFTGMFVQPNWETFVLVSHLSGVVPIPDDVDFDTADDALYIGQSMPWIDPLKEALSWEALTKAGFASEVEVIRKRGGNPRDLLEQVDAFRKEAKEKGLIFSSDSANSKSTAPEVIQAALETDVKNPANTD